MTVSVTSLAGGNSASSSGASDSANLRLPSPKGFDIFDTYRATDRRSLALPTPYSGIGPDLVHPSVVYAPTGWQGWRYWMAYTPYPGANSAYENPCIAVSQDGELWESPAGLTNPLVEKPANGYNADTQLFLSPDLKTMYMAYRERIGSALNSVKVMQSTNGVSWSTPVAVLSGAVGTQDYASPSIFWDAINLRWVCISHNLDGGTSYPMQRNVTSGADIYSGWAANEAIAIVNPTAGRTFWHSGFAQLPDGKVIGLIQDIVNGGAGAAGALFSAESLDGGITFSVKPVYADTLYYRPNISFSELPSGEITMQAWIGRQAGGVFSIKREDWRQGATEKALRDASTEISVRGRTPGRFLWWDTFNRADGALGAPTVGSTVTVDTGTFTIVSNKATSGTVGNNRAMVSVGTPDYVAEATITAAATAAYLIFRGVDTTNFYRVGFSAGLPSALTVQSIVGGAVGSLNQSVKQPGETLPLTFSGTVNIRVVCRGRRFRLYVNDAFLQEWPDLIYYATGTRFGIQATNAGVAFDNLLAMS